MTAGRCVSVLAVVTVGLAVASPAAARTLERRYTPFAADATLRSDLRAATATGGMCATGSFVVAGPGVYRCFAGSVIRDPCYLDVLASSRGVPLVVCATDPWSRHVVRLHVHPPLDGREGAAAADPPWALRLASGRRCAFVTGATFVLDGRRMNYDCDGRYLFGQPDRGKPTWRIRQALTPGGIGMRSVAIATAWR